MLPQGVKPALPRQFTPQKSIVRHCLSSGLMIPVDVFMPLRCARPRERGERPKMPACACDQCCGVQSFPLLFAL